MGLVQCMRCRGEVDVICQCADVSKAVRYKAERGQPRRSMALPSSDLFRESVLDEAAIARLWTAINAEIGD